MCCSRLSPCHQDYGESISALGNAIGVMKEQAKETVRVGQRHAGVHAHSYGKLIRT